jgi:N4-gp56 family major capsid protein
MALTTTSNLAQAIRTVYSKEVLFFAQPVMKFEQFANIETQLSVEAGSDIKVLKYSNLASGGTLAEGTNMTTQALSASLIAVTVVEYGNGVSVTELLLRQSFDKIMTQTSKLLGLDYATVNDLMLRDSLMTITGLQVKYAGARASRDLLTASDSFNTALVKDGVELLATNNVPKINGDFYVVFVHPHQARKMRDDAAWINASQYGAPDQIFKGEIGRYEDAVFIETTQIKSIAAGVAFNGVTNATVPTYQAVMFGADAFAKAIALPVEMRDNGIEDFSRKHSLAWYAIQGAKRIDDTRVVMLESA